MDTYKLYCSGGDLKKVLKRRNAKEKEMDGNNRKNVTMTQEEPVSVIRFTLKTGPLLLLIVGAYCD